MWKYIYSVRCESTQRRNILVDLCETWWFERTIRYERFYVAIPFIAESFEITYETHPELEQFLKFALLVGMLMPTEKPKASLML